MPRKRSVKPPWNAESHCLGLLLQQTARVLDLAPENQSLGKQFSRFLALVCGFPGKLGLAVQFGPWHRTFSA
jgi:hypothetical protein